MCRRLVFPSCVLFSNGKGRKYETFARMLGPRSLALEVKLTNFPKVSTKKKLKTNNIKEKLQF